MDKLAKNLVKLAKITACSWAFFFIAVILTLMSKGHSFQSIAMILVIISSIVSISLTSATLFAMCISKGKQQKANADDRRNVSEECPMIQENGICIPIGNSCSLVNSPMCDALHYAYTIGQCSILEKTEEEKRGEEK